MARSAWVARVPTGSAELMSMTSAPCGRFAASAPPSVSSRQARTSLPVGSMVTMASTCLPSSASVAADFAPVSLANCAARLPSRVIGDDRVAALDQIGRHRPAHIADADEADGLDCHSIPLLSVPCQFLAVASTSGLMSPIVSIIPKLLRQRLRARVAEHRLDQLDELRLKPGIVERHDARAERLVGLAHELAARRSSR